MKILKGLVLVFISFLTLTAIAEEEKYPETARQRRATDFGSLVGGPDGLVVYNSNPNAGSIMGGKGGGSINVNPYLWQAALNTIAFMPLASTDSNGGVIITDWYEDPNFPGERYKVNIFITSMELRVESLKVTVFKQALRSGTWREVPVNSQITLDLEEKILTKARELKIAHK
jgi:hypothetical protein